MMRLTNPFVYVILVSLIGSFLVPSFAGTDSNTSFADAEPTQVTLLWQVPLPHGNDLPTKQAAFLSTSISEAPASATTGEQHRPHTIS
uniref:Putative secreted protein n=1 Tax=Ixodes ricinus TaxID=34613 RepID=A0A6B0U223_IXORI